MRISIMTMVFGRLLETGELRDTDLLEALRKAGYDGIEVPAGRLLGEAARIREYVSCMKDKALAATCVDAGCNFVSRDGASREAAVDTLRRSVDLAAELGSPLVLAAGSRLSGDIAPAEGRRMTIEGLRAGVEYARQAGIALAIENFGVAPTLQCAAKDCLEVLEGVPGLVFAFDTGNFYFCGEDPVGNLDALGPKTRHVHLKDWVKSDAPEIADVAGAALGAGFIPNAKIVEHFLECRTEAGGARRSGFPTGPARPNTGPVGKPDLQTAEVACFSIELGAPGDKLEGARRDLATVREWIAAAKKGGSLVKTRFQSVRLSLADIAGEEYAGAVCEARRFLSGGGLRDAQRLARQKIDFYPSLFYRHLLELLPFVGAKCLAPFEHSSSGAAPADVRGHAKTFWAPTSALGFFRAAEDGRLFLTAKCEHYHASLGHGFPGYALLDCARRLGVPNATHNNTRGHLARLLETELVRTAAGIAREDARALERVLDSTAPRVLNRVLNLETGSLAAEAAIKLLLARFYRPQADSPKPKYEGRTPVFIVLGDDAGARHANYHGTTVIAQMMRGMWPRAGARLERSGILVVRAVRPNDCEDLERAFAENETGRRKSAGVFLELIMMNYGAKRLDKAYVRRVAALAKRHDAPVVVDEIQTGAWSPEVYLFREYGLAPDAVVLGKGFSGGEYAASRVLFGAPLDTLPQFGALVTNGQEELASLAYLVTMRWIEANAEIVRCAGEYYEQRLRELAQEHRDRICAVEGRRHLAGICFHEEKASQTFAARANAAGVDISVQTYKRNFPPTALTKLPLIAGFEVVDALLERFEWALGRR